MVGHIQNLVVLNRFVRDTQLCPTGCEEVANLDDVMGRKPIRVSRY
jgi:hypothetical protein